MTSPFESKDRVQHQVSDTDLNWASPHHTLGRGPTQAAPGNHTHEDSGTSDGGSGSGSGTIILSGTASPTVITGNVGDYYLDTDDRILYGPKLAEAVIGTSVFTTQTPTPGWYNAREQGVRITCATAGTITALRWYRLAGTSQTTRTMKLWNVSNGGLLASVVTSAETGTGWNTATLTTPVAVTAGQQVVASFNLTAECPGTNPAGLPITHDMLTATAAVAGDPIGTFPNLASSTNYFVDIVFGSVANPWPVALKSVPPGGTTGQSLKKTSNVDYAVGWVT